MIPRALGVTGLRLSPIGLGTVKLGRSAGLSLATPARIPDDAEAVALLETARDLGVNLIDTSPAYGRSEERLGELLARVPADWVVVTKAGETFDGRSHHDFSGAALRASVERSLLHLRRTVLDVVLLHFSSAVDDVKVLQAGEAMQTLAALKQEGKCRAIGASASTGAGAAAALAGGADLVMVTINAAEPWGIEAARLAGECGAGVLVKKALGGGRRDPAAAIPFALAAPGVTSVVVGTTNVANLRACVASAQ
ncbi:MAG: aldo/keto reductase [Phycisphaerales bacterium]